MGLIATAQGYPLLCHFVDGEASLVVGWTDTEQPVVVFPGAVAQAVLVERVASYSVPAGPTSVGLPPAKPPKTTGPGRRLL